MTKEYKIDQYYESTDTYRLIGDNEIIYADLFVDGSFKDFPSNFFDKMSHQDRRDIKQSLIGKTIEVGDFIPLIFSANHIKIKL